MHPSPSRESSLPAVRLHAELTWALISLGGAVALGILLLSVGTVWIGAEGSIGLWLAGCIAIAAVMAWRLWSIRQLRLAREQQVASMQQGLLRLAQLANSAGKPKENLQLVTDALCETVGALQVGVFALRERNASQGTAQQFDLVARAGVNGPAATEAHHRSTGNLLERALSVERALTLDQLPQGYLTLQSGLGRAEAQHLVMLPLMAGGQAIGVLELVAFQPLKSAQVGFAEQAAALIASVLHVGQASARTVDMLARSERANHALQAQQAEMQRNLEQLFEAQRQTSQAQAELSLASQLNQKLFDEANDGKGISDGYVFTDCNPELVRLLGAETRDHVKGRTLLEFSPAVQPGKRLSDASLRQYVEAAKRQGQSTFEWLFERPNGESWHAEVNLLRLSGTGEQTLVYQIRDVTARKQSETELRELNETLQAREKELRRKVTELTEAQTAKQQVEVQLIEKERRLSQISNNAPAIIYRFVNDSDTGDSRFMFVSAAAQRLSGYPMERWMSFSQNDFFELIHAEDREEVRHRSRQSVEQLQPFVAEARMLTAWGEYKWMRMSSNPTAVTQTRVLSDGIITDIDEVKALIMQVEEKNSELRAQEEELRQNAEELLTVNEEVERRNFDLQRSQKELSEAFEQLRKSELELEHKVELRTAELLAAKEEADRANQVKSLFLANMSHELRTPLNGILGYAQILHDAPTLPDPLRDKIGIIHRSGEHLLGLINEVLDLSKIEAGQMELSTRRFSLPSFLRELRDLFLLRAQAKRLTLECILAEDLPKTVIADEVKLRQCLVNLLSNAIKFTSSGTVRLEVTRQRDGRLRFMVTDTGRGIPTERIKDIVMPFKQLSAHLNTEGGTGLGLAITKSYVEMMGGKLSITSEVGKGSAFGFSVHLEEAEVSSLGASAEDAGDEVNLRVTGYSADRTLKILVVDDNEINREVATEILSTVGFEIQQAEDGEGAIAAFEAFRPDMILMDVRMPGMSGLEATQRIRSLPGGDSVKISAVTASVFEGERKTIFKFGCDDYLPKPYKVAELFEMIKKHLVLDYTVEAVSHSTVSSQPQSGVELDWRKLSGHLPKLYLKQLSEALDVGDYAEVRRRTEAIRKDDNDVRAFKQHMLYLLSELHIDAIEAIRDQLLLGSR
jgi:PAS domain S-box-containing protein